MPSGGELCFKSNILLAVTFSSEELAKILPEVAPQITTVPII